MHLCEGLKLSRIAAYDRPYLDLLHQIGHVLPPRVCLLLAQKVFVAPERVVQSRLFVLLCAPLLLD